MNPWATHSSSSAALLIPNKQDWFAVAIEFFIAVAEIFVGLQGTARELA